LLPTDSPEAFEAELPETFEEDDLTTEVPEIVPEKVIEEVAIASSGKALIDLESGLRQVPEALRKEMEELLRADFTEVIRWNS